jgi:hypothetical protein
MTFQLGANYTRLFISSAFGLPEDPHAVIMSGGKVKAIVVAKNGRHPSGKQYRNELKADTFLMHGEHDYRGAALENTSVKVPLFFSHGSDGNYRYEGEVQWTNTDDWDGEPFRLFKRL